MAQKTPDTTREERDIVNGIALKLWEDYCNEMEDEGELLDLFSKTYGVSKNSRLAMMFHAFVGGIVQGLNLTETLDTIAREGEA